MIGGIVLLVAAAVVADHHVDPAAKAMVMKLLNMDAKDMHHCKTDAECASVEGKPKCCTMMRLCGPENMPKFNTEDKTCTDHDGCPPAHRCADGKCKFTGPRGCDADADCPHMEGVTMECKEHAKEMPGKRCWAKCTTDNDCHHCVGDKCRMPEELKAKIGCCNGFCHRKSTCN